MHFFPPDDNQVSRRNKVIIDIIFQVLKRHNINSHICRYGCDALIEITNNSCKASFKNPFMRPLFVLIDYFQLGPGKTKMVDAVIEAIKGNTRDIEMWRSGCGLLKNIATNCNNIFTIHQPLGSHTKSHRGHQGKSNRYNNTWDERKHRKHRHMHNRMRCTWGHYIKG